MFDFDAARRMMVDCQIRTSDITDHRIIDAMFELPRERFVPANESELAYLDKDLPLDAADGHPARRLIKPVITAKLLQMAEIELTDHVLVVGCATGYSAAVAAQLAGSVVALEQDRSLIARARETLAGTPNVTIVEGPLAEGWTALAPYDAILVEGAIEIEPESLARQLKPGGRLTCMQGGNPGRGMVYRWINGDLSGRPVFDGTAPVLPGFSQASGFVF